MAKPLAEIENPQNLRLHKQGWAAQKVFRVVLFGFVLAAALGAFGTGVLSKREQRLGTRLVVRSERMARVDAATRLDILSLTGEPADRLVITLPHPFLARYALDKVWPEPLTQSSTANGVHYGFQRRAGSHIVFSFIPKEPGRTQTSLLIGREAIDFSQIIYP